MDDLSDDSSEDGYAGGGDFVVSADYGRKDADDGGGER